VLFVLVLRGPCIVTGRPCVLLVGCAAPDVMCADAVEGWRNGRAVLWHASLYLAACSSHTPSTVT
jgi:hypothetical protein